MIRFAEMQKKTPAPKVKELSEVGGAQKVWIQLDKFGSFDLHHHSIFVSAQRTDPKIGWIWMDSTVPGFTM